MWARAEEHEGAGPTGDCALSASRCRQNNWQNPKGSQLNHRSVRAKRLKRNALFVEVAFFSPAKVYLPP